jgi:HPt (histidine-containing phosphotransfer) domain-containing protein
MNWSKDFVAQLLEAQRVEYVQALPDKLAELDALWAQVAAGSAGTGEALAGLERLAHGLHGTAGSLGLAGLGDAGSALERAMQALRAAPGAADGNPRLGVAQAVEAVRAAALNLPEPPSLPR